MMMNGCLFGNEFFMTITAVGRYRLAPKLMRLNYKLKTVIESQTAAIN
jgi:hypothetical protein